MTGRTAQCQVAPPSADSLAFLEHASYQENDQLAGSAAALGLTETDLLPTLAVGQGLWRIRDRAFVVAHQLTRGELEVFDTAARMNG